MTKRCNFLLEEWLRFGWSVMLQFGYYVCVKIKFTKNKKEWTKNMINKKCVKNIGKNIIMLEPMQS